MMLRVIENWGQKEAWQEDEEVHIERSRFYMFCLISFVDCVLQAQWSPSAEEAGEIGPWTQY
jgi:hypothetical protein